MLCDRIFNGVLIQAVLVRDPFKVYLVLREWTMILAHRRTLSVVGDHSYGGESECRGGGCKEARMIHSVNQPEPLYSGIISRGAIDK